jgi:hypothetical protein
MWRPKAARRTPLGLRPRPSTDLSRLLEDPIGMSTSIDKPLEGVCAS